MKPANTNTTPTEQLRHHQTVSAPSVEPQVKTHLMATDVSFSSYLASNKSDRRTSAPHEHPGSTASELSIFDAQKYFSEGSEHDQVLSSSKRVSPLKEFNNLNLGDSSSIPRFSSASSVDGYGPSYRTRSLASSEASWNSQTGLLSSNAQGANSGTQTNSKRCFRVIPRWLLFRPRCPCSGKKSVQVKERSEDNLEVSTRKEAVELKMPVELRGVKVNVIPDSQERSVNATRRLRPTPEDPFPSELGGRHLLVSVPVPQKPFIDSSISSSTGFTFPILPPPSMSVSSPPPRIRMPQHVSSHASPDPHQNPPLPDDPPLDAPKFFMPPSDELPDSRKSQENRTHHQLLKFPISLKYQTSMAADEGDELGSDASSDLFEIESISTQATYPIIHQKQRDSLEEARPGTPSNKNSHVDENQGKVSEREKAEDYSVSLPEFERSPKI